MSDNRSVFQRYIDEFWNGDLDVADELYPDDHRYHDPNLPDLPQGPRASRSAVASTRPRSQCGWSSPRLGGGRRQDRLPLDLPRHPLGPPGDIPLTAREVTIPGIHLLHFRDGMIAESWVMCDRLGALEQLGIVRIGAAE